MSFDTFLNNEINNMINSLDRLVSIPSVGTEAVNDAPFGQEALKALYQYNGYDIEYNHNFVEIEPKQHARSAIFPQYYSRWDTVNEIYDSYKRLEGDRPFNYDHLSGSEIVYYPTRNEFRVWNHA